MHIAFDLDGTLIPERFQFPLELKPRNPLRRYFCQEPLRLGTPDFINQLWANGHTVSIYTTSLRDPYWTRMMFRAYRTRVARVINTQIHQRQIRKLGNAYKSCSKYPPAFRIDLLIDNCGGVVCESQRYNFAMLQIHPEDVDWINTISKFIGMDQRIENPAC